MGDHLASFATLIALVAGPFVFVGPPAHAADRCADPASQGAVEAALDQAHRLSSGDESVPRFVERALPLVRCLESAAGADDDRLHQGVHVGRLLLHFDRVDDARSLFAAVERLDPSGRWGRQAANQIYTLDNLAPGMPAPAFTGRTLSGETLGRDDLLGQVVVVDFWATWCPPCVTDLARLRDLLRRFGDNGLRVVGVALDEEREPLERMIAERQVSWPQLWDGEGGDGEIPRLFAVEGPATFFVLDRRGRIAAGPLSGDDLEAAVARALDSADRPTR